MEIIKIFFIIMLFFLLSWTNFFIFCIMSGVFYYYKNKKQELLIYNQNTHLLNVLILSFVLIVESIYLHFKVIYSKIKNNMIIKNIMYYLKKINSYYLNLKITFFIYLTSSVFKLIMGNDKPIESNVRPVSVLKNQSDINNFLDKLK